VITNFTTHKSYVMNGRGAIISEDHLEDQFEPASYRIPHGAQTRRIENLECFFYETHGVEAWISTELKHVVEERIIDEKGVECTWRMHDIVRIDPPPAMFEP
jgi:hypothetical protein